MDLTEWTQKWGHLLPQQAVTELVSALSHGYEAPSIQGPADPNKNASEARVQSLVRIEAVQAGVWLTRNNVGVLRDANGRPVRYGLANESKQQNAVVKSGDLIGWRRRVIVQRDVGKVIAQFVSRECKHEGWKPSPTDKHEMAQRAWANLVNINGGDAAFASGPGSFNYSE